jgi:hypothetical protein
MRKTPSKSLFLTALVAVVLLTGCGSSGIGDILGGGTGGGTGSDGRYEPSQSNVSDVRGTIERVDTRNRLIVVDGEAYRNNLRNDGLRNGGSGNEIVLYYDDRTTVEHEGRTYNPQDLEPGDRIQADVDQSGDRLLAQQIDVLYDATSGTTSSGSTGTWDDQNDRDTLGTTEVRGTVLSVDTRNRMVELERRSGYGSNFNSGGSTGSTGRNGEVVRVYYDSSTIVEYQGQRYSPENLERGDMVEVEVDESGGRLIAQEILVVGEGGSIGR